MFEMRYISSNFFDVHLRQQSDRKMTKSYFIDDRFRYRRATGEGRTDECRGNWSHESSGRTSSDKIHYI